MAPDQRNNRGFTLLEVLVAFAILAVFLGATLPTLSRSLAGTRTGGETIAATAYAQSLLDGVGAAGRVRPGSFAERLVTPGFRSRLTVRPYGADPGDPRKARLYEVSAEVSWESGERERSVRLDSLRYAVEQ